VDMKKKQPTGKKELLAESSPIATLLEETEQNLSSWLQDPSPLQEMLLSFAPEIREDFFLSLLGKENGRVLSLLEAVAGKDERLDLALARSLGRWNSPRGGDLLRRMVSDTSSPPVLKAIRKSIFQLRSQGLAVGEIEDSTPSVYRPPRPVSAEGFLSSIDPTGSRLVWLVRPQIPQGLLAFQALISDLQGLVDFNGFETSRRKFQEYLGNFRNEVPWEIVEAGAEYCHGLIIEALEINQQKGEPPPETFLKWRALMGAPPEVPLKPLIYHHLSDEDGGNRPDLLDRSGSLFDLPIFQSWFMGKEEVQKYLHLWEEASQSRLVLTPYQQEGRLMDIYRQAVEELFDKPRRALFRRRLEEMAYILWVTGKEKEARIALVAAREMEAVGGILYTHPFLLELIKRSLAARREEAAGEKEKEQPTGLLIEP
jgi:hypothetical protein